jgi:assimilatory nitrate reductase catalytic subunit
LSAPDALHVERRLAALDTLVVCDFFLSETACFADVVLRPRSGRSRTAP